MSLPDERYFRNIRYDESLQGYIGRETIDGHLDGHRYKLKPGMFETLLAVSAITPQYDGFYEGWIPIGCLEDYTSSTAWVETQRLAVTLNRNTA